MAITQSTQRVAQVAAAKDFGDRLNDKRQVSGEVQFAYIDLVIPADQAALSVVELYELPEGMIVIPEQSFAYISDDITSGAATLNIGDAVDADRYAVGINVASVGRVEFMSGTLPDAYTNRHRTVNTGVASTTTTLIKLTFATLTATVEAGAIRIVLAYKSL